MRGGEGKALMLEGVSVQSSPGARIYFTFAAVRQHDITRRCGPSRRGSFLWFESRCGTGSAIGRRLRDAASVAPYFTKGDMDPAPSLADFDSAIRRLGAAFYALVRVHAGHTTWVTEKRRSTMGTTQRLSEDPNFFAN